MDFRAANPITEYALSRCDRHYSALVAAKAAKKTRQRETGELACQLSANPEIFRGSFAAVFLLFVAHLGALIEVAQASSFHGRDVYKHVFSAGIGLNKSKSFGRVEPLHSTCRHVRTPF